MKLLLTSTGLSTEKIKNKFIENFQKDFNLSKVLFITSASESDEENKYVEESKRELLELGFLIENIIVYHDGEKPSKQELDQIDLIYVCGGNTFRLLERLRRSGLEQEIYSMIKRDVFYFGVSAGSIIVTPSIRIAEPWDPNENQLKDLTGFNLIDFTVSPHYVETEEEIVRNIEKEDGINVKRITDTQALYIHDNSVNLIGTEMRLENEPFNLIKDGNKIIEARLKDEKRSQLNIGDEIEFTNRKTNQTLNTRVIDLLFYPSFKAMLDDNDIFDFGSNNKDQYISQLSSFYSEEDISKYGVVGIKIELI